MDNSYLSPVVLGGGGFGEWFKTLPLMRSLDQGLNSIFHDASLCDGIELSVDFPQLFEWHSFLEQHMIFLPLPFSRLSNSLSRQIFQRTHNSIHLAAIKTLTPGMERTLCRALETISKVAKISHFVTHPDGSQQRTWQKICDHLPAGITLSVENLDLRASNYRTLAEFESLLSLNPKLSMTFDTCHWIEAGRSLEDPELLDFMRRFGHRISNIHFSVPTSNSTIYDKWKDQNILHLFHYDSGIKIPEKFIDISPRSCRWVLEGWLPPGAIDSLYNELVSVKELRQTNRRVARRRTATLG